MIRLAVPAVARREDVLALAHHFDRHHHALVFVLYHVAVKHEPPHNLRCAELLLTYRPRANARLGACIVR